MAESPVARQWAALLDDFDRSGLTVGAFARLHDVNPRTLSWWRWRLARRSRALGPAFVEVQVARSPALGVELRDGAVRIAVTECADLGLLRRVVDALC